MVDLRTRRKRLMAGMTAEQLRAQLEFEYQTNDEFYAELQVLLRELAYLRMKLIELGAGDELPPEPGPLGHGRGLQ